jgi:hypothetical protein
MEILNSTNAVSVGLPASQRPLAGIDLAAFGERSGLTRMEVVAALALASPGMFNELTRHGALPLPFERELLLRRHLKMATRPPRRTPHEVFHAIYGDLLARFKELASDPVAESARVMLYERFAALFGKTVYTAYRWLRVNNNGDHGQATLPMLKLLASLPESPQHMREVLENLAREAYEARGLDFDAEFPLPDLARPPQPRRRGRPSRRSGGSGSTSATSPVSPSGDPRKERTTR